MEEIHIDETKGESIDDGFKKLMAAKYFGDDAKWRYLGHVLTTDMLPERWMNMQFDDVIIETQRNESIIRSKIIQEQTGQSIIGTKITHEQYYEMFDKYEQEAAKEKNNPIQY